LFLFHFDFLWSHNFFSPRTFKHFSHWLKLPAGDRIKSILSVTNGEPVVAASFAALRFKSLSNLCISQPVLFHDSVQNCMLAFMLIPSPLLPLFVVATIAIHHTQVQLAV